MSTPIMANHDLSSKGIRRNKKYLSVGHQLDNAFGCPSLLRPEEGDGFVKALQFSFKQKLFASAFKRSPGLRIRCRFREGHSQTQTSIYIPSGRIETSG